MVATLPVLGMWSSVFFMLRMIWKKNSLYKHYLQSVVRVVEKSLKARMKEKENKEGKRGDLPLGCQRSKFGRRTACFFFFSPGLPFAHIPKLQRDMKISPPPVGSSSSPTQERYIGTTEYYYIIGTPVQIKIVFFWFLLLCYCNQEQVVLPIPLLLNRLTGGTLFIDTR